MISSLVNVIYPSVLGGSLPCVPLRVPGSAASQDGAKIRCLEGQKLSGTRPVGLVLINLPSLTTAVSTPIETS